MGALRSYSRALRERPLALRGSRALRACQQVGLSLTVALGFAGISLLPAQTMARAASDRVGMESEATLPSVLVLGDSISAAYGMSLEQGWVALLERRLLLQGRISEIINASISGDTSAGGLRRLPQLLEDYQPDILVLELGGNDGLRGYPTQKLRENLTAMAQLATQAGSQVLILPMEIPPNYGARYTQAFRNAFREAAHSTDAILGPFLLDGIATQTKFMQADGIHPTQAAQSLIVEQLTAAFEQALEALHDSQNDSAAS